MVLEDLIGQFLYGDKKPTAMLIKQNLKPNNNLYLGDLWWNLLSLKNGLA